MGVVHFYLMEAGAMLSTLSLLVSSEGAQKGGFENLEVLVAKIIGGKWDWIFKLVEPLNKRESDLGQLIWGDGRIGAY